MFDFVVVIYGVVATLVSFGLGFTFYRLPTDFGRPIAYMAWGGAVVGLGTLVFSAASLFGFYSLLTSEVMATLRIIIFVAITGPDVFMMATISRLRRDQEND